MRCGGTIVLQHLERRFSRYLPIKKAVIETARFIANEFVRVRKSLEFLRGVFGRELTDAVQVGATDFSIIGICGNMENEIRVHV